MKNKSIQKRIPNNLYKKCIEISNALQKEEFYMELGFLTPPSPNDVLKKALILGLKEIEKMMTENKKENKQTPEKEVPKNHSEKISPKRILGDFA
ncbi:hypothetical protein [Persephonella sp. KM09-Lau-8]|uniref:hypothetical protein n=1 Tax=Persephonella sp. KM09-Lau-8 TaxID=1158345 RepID=UPI000496B4FA|nr:hypothetical protein [Persephonella sp. KM09-Lau-8]